MIAEKNAILPISASIELIKKTVRENQVTILEGETATGKSTQTPQILFDQFQKIFIGLPHRFLAKSLARRIASEMGTEVGNLVGYKLGDTGKGIHDRNYSDQTKVLTCTYEILVKYLLRMKKDRDCLIILDEIHEWNLHAEIAVGRINDLLKRFPKLRVVLMSATMGANSLSEFFGGAPIIKIEGRNHPVEEKEAGEDNIADTIQLFNEGHNVLLFEEGVEEINAAITALKEAGVKAKILPLHSKLDPEAQDLAMKIYDRQKIVVATNIAESSLTIPGITAVVDPGFKKSKMVVNGVDRLITVKISKAESKQRKGRAGREEPGVYVRPPFDLLDDYPVPEIRRMRLDKTVLQLLIEKINIETLRLVHQPYRSDVLEAKRTLRLLGCIDHMDTPTEIGIQVDKLPLGIHTGRMVVEAISRGVLADVITIAAILESESFLHRDNQQWKSMYNGEKESDLLGALSVFKRLGGINDNEELWKNGIVKPNLITVRETRSKLVYNLEKSYHVESSGDRAEILASITAGMLDRLFVMNGGSLVGQNGQYRLPSRYEVTSSRNGEMIVGVPRDIPYEHEKYGPQILKLVTFQTKVNFEMIAAFAANIEEVGFSFVDGEAIYDPREDAVFGPRTLLFMGHETTRVDFTVQTGKVAERIFKNSLAEILAGESPAPECLKHVVETIRARNHRCATIQKEMRTFQYTEWSYFFFESWLISKIAGITSIKEIKDPSVLIPQESLDSIVENHKRSFPDEIVLEGIGVKRIDYTVGVPTIKIEGEEWKNLPDKDIKLPNGHVIALDVWYLGERVLTRATDCVYAKFHVSDLVVRELEDQFIRRNETNERHELVKMIAEFPAVRKEISVVHPLRGHSIEAFGVLCHESGEDFVWKWFFNLSEAEEARIEEVRKVKETYFNSLRKLSILRSKEGQSNLSDGWVIRESGQPRSSNTKEKGMMVWDRVEASELVLKWTCEDKAKPETQKFTIVQYPMSELTDNQKSAVARIVKEVKCLPGQFENAKLEPKFLNVLSKSFSICPLSGQRVIWVDSDLYRLASRSGKILGSGPDVKEMGEGFTPTTSAYGCHASIIEEQEIDGEVFELLAFEHENVWKLAIRTKL